jgi:hypothetical protein
MEDGGVAKRNAEDDDDERAGDMGANPLVGVMALGVATMVGLGVP